MLGQQGIMWVFKRSAGWLLFWLLVCPPVGILYLIFDMEEEDDE